MPYLSRSEEEWRRRDRLRVRLIRSLIGALIFLCIVAATATYGFLNNKSDIQSNQDRIEQATNALCLGIQRVRAEVNRSNTLLFQTYDLQARYSLALGSRPGYVLYKGIARKPLYTPPTNCKAAIAHPNTYVRPDPRPMYQVANPIEFPESVQKSIDRLRERLQNSPQLPAGG